MLFIDHGEGQIAIVVNGRSSSSEGGDAFPDDFAGWREFLEEEQRGPRCPRRFRPQFHWELLACGVGGHELIGTDAATMRPDDALYAREEDGVRWYRCVRCDSWLPLAPPDGEPGK